MARRKVVNQVEEAPKVIPIRHLRKNRKNVIQPSNASQYRFLEAIKENTIVFNIGPAGSGKTTIAASWAFESVLDKTFRKMILTRPAVDACGEKIGFLPGGIEDKMLPFMQPIYDVLFEYGVTRKDIEHLIEEEYIEICPLAFMRGRSIRNAVVIAEEAQNMTSAQMEMLLTRMGEGSKLIVTGDTSQRDLRSADGIEQAVELFKDVSGIEFIHFPKSDILRSALTEMIVSKYEKSR